jgi:mycofactocin precursor peptide peptidase
VRAGSSLTHLTSPDVAAGGARCLVAVPLGATEQHGPHLPLSTDTCIAVELCQRLASCRDDVLVAPAVPYGSSGEHASFAGTLSIGQQALYLLVVELVRSANSFAAVVLVSAHGGNAEPLARAVRHLQAEGRRVTSWSPRVHDPCDLHAGHAETSAMLALDPAGVRMGRARAGTYRPLAEVMPEMRAGGVAAVSANGVLGDPLGASAEAGEALLRSWAADLAQTVAQWVE